MSVKTNTISERTAEAGVTIDGLLIKDGILPDLPGAGITSDQAATLAAYQAALTAAETGQVLTAVVGEESRGVEFAGLTLPKRSFSFMAITYPFDPPFIPPTILQIDVPSDVTFTFVRTAVGTYTLTSDRIVSTTTIITQLKRKSPVFLYITKSVGVAYVYVFDATGTLVDGQLEHEFLVTGLS